MLVIFLLLVFATSEAVEFSSRPTNVTITLLYFTQSGTETTTVLAPYGLWSLMAGLSYGSTGSTSREISLAFSLLTDRKKFTNRYQTLKKALFDEPGYGVSITNRNFYFVDSEFQKLIEIDFRDMMIEDFDTSFKVLDFQDPSAARIANTYIEILAPPVTNMFNADDFRDSSIILANVFFFKGLWSLPFTPTETRVEGQVSMMYQRAKVPYSHVDSMQASVMELSYGSDGKYCMLIIIPDPAVNVRTVYRNFAHVSFKDIFTKLQNDTAEFGLKEMDVKLPKFKRISNVYLNKPLNDMGVYNAFEPDYASFSRMVREPIYIETVESTTSIIVNEQGTVVFATTPGRRDFKVDINEKVPPRIIFILEKTTATTIFGGIFV